MADLPHYWRSLPSDSDLKAKYAPPAAAKGGALGALGALVVGIVVDAEQQRTAWESSRVCLACTGQF